MQFESKGQEEFVDLKAELLAEGSLERWKYERDLEWQEVKRREEESRRNERPAPPTKSLYEQLKERNDQKEAEREQKRSLKNYVYTGPSEEELNLIQSISTCESDQRIRIEREERQGVEEFRKKIETAKREDIDKETVDEEIVVQKDSIPNSKGNASKAQKKSLISSVVVKPRANRKRPIQENDRTDAANMEIIETNSKKRNNPESPITKSSSKRPSLVSYSSDSDSAVEGKGRN